MKANKTERQRSKTIITLILLAATLMTAGCFTSCSGTKQETADNTGNSKTTASSAKPAQSGQKTTATASPESAAAALLESAAEALPESAAAVPPKQGQVDGSKISFQRTTTTPDWKQIETFDKECDFSLVEDGQGILHLINHVDISHLYHCFQMADGSWSEPQKITNSYINDEAYWVGTAPDGSLCFSWHEINNESEISFDEFHISLFKDGQWREESKVYNFKNSEVMERLGISWFNIAFDTYGEPHFFYYALGAYLPSEGKEETQLKISGLFLDSQQLTQEDYINNKQFSVMQGIGDIEDEYHDKRIDKKVLFYIDSANVYHLIGLDENSVLDDHRPLQYTRCIRSYSRDGGKTWEGPFTAFDGEYRVNRISFAEDTKGNICIMANYPESDEATLMVSSLKPDKLDAGATEGYFYEKQINDFDYNEWDEFINLKFSDIFFDSKDILHFITGMGRDMWENPFWDMTQIKGNEWAIRKIDKPVGYDDAEILAFSMRRNGDFVLLANERGVEEPMLFYAQIPAGG